MTISSYDRMANVFPTVFDFKKGEQPSSRKLTKWVKLTDNAFSLITQAVGDPWDYQSHEGDLSPQNLGQATIARAMGPSDYIGPLGETINSDQTTVEVQLSIDGASSWYLGFPLIKRVGTATPQMLPSSVEFLDVSDVAVSSASSGYEDYFDIHYTDPRDMSQKGDYHIDFARGIIQTYVPIDPNDGNPSDGLKATISDLSFIGAGAPWASHNIIPIWEDSTTGVTIIETAAGPGNYQITLPGRDVSGYSNAYPRVGAPSDSASGSMTGAGYPESDPLTGNRYQTTLAARPTGDVSYRLPYALEANYSSGDVLPGGAVKLWRNSTSSFVPLTEFEYVDPTTLSLTCPELSDVDNVTGDSDNYRLVVVGTSLAEQVSYLAGAVREGQGQGMSIGGPATFPSVSFGPPMSHDRLRDRYGFSLAMEESGDFSAWAASHDNWQKRFAFTESAYPTNPHPQYLHRAGYLPDDEAANTSNAMRGWMCFAGHKTAASGYDYAISDEEQWSAADPPLGEWTYGVVWGMGNFDSDSTDHPRMFFDGGRNKSWNGYGPAARLGFGMPGPLGQAEEGIGFEEPSSGANYGAIVYEGYRGQPLYLRGRKGISDSDFDTSIHGSAIGFDLGDRNELNYLKILGGDRPSSDGTYAGDPENDPAWVSQTIFSILPMTPALSARLSAEQTRELRFRGGSYIETPYNSAGSVWELSTSDSRGSTGTHKKTVAVRELDSASDVILLQGDVIGDIHYGDYITLSGTSSDDGDKAITGGYLITTVSWGECTALVTSTGVNASENPDAQAEWTTYEFNRYFKSPGILGGDFINVYSNAIFFSEEGDGKKTSFTERGREWLSEGTTVPSGIFYVPRDVSEGTEYGSAAVFSGYEGPGGTQYDQAKLHGYLGHKRGSWINSTLGARRGLQFEGHDDTGTHVVYNTIEGATTPASEAAEQGLSCVVYKVPGAPIKKGTNQTTISDIAHLPKCIRDPEEGSIDDNFATRVVGIQVIVKSEPNMGTHSFNSLSEGITDIGGYPYLVERLTYYIFEENELRCASIWYKWNRFDNEPSEIPFEEEMDFIFKIWYMSNRPSITSVPNESGSPIVAELAPWF